jgi:hypothetical protein
MSDTVDHTVRFHAKLSASRVPRVALCAGSLLAEDALPAEPSGEAAAKGTAIHELAERILTGQPLPDDAPAVLVEVAQKYAHVVTEQTKGSKRRFVELNVTDALKTIHPWLGGTADYVAVGGGVLTVVDLKTGRNEVDPEWNPQLLTYALGASIALKAPANVKVRLAIFQPDCGGWNEFWCAYPDLMDWRDSLLSVANRAMQTNAPRTPTPEACKYCRARVHCPELQAQVKEQAKQEHLVDANNTITMEMLDAAELCSIWADSVKEAGKRQLIDKPDSIPGWKMREGRKMVKWKDNKMAAAMLSGHLEAFELKSVSAVQKLGLDIPPSLIDETRTASSLVRAK